jgi:hypothetical protein
MDWYRTVKAVYPDRRVRFLTDVVESEGHHRIVRDDDDLVQLVNVDRALFRTQSRLGNVWRNAFKALMIPVQVVSLARFARRHRGSVYHAHTMYYMCLCWLAGVPFVGTPQGSEVLVRPVRSRVYRWFAARALAAARIITVDSVPMRRGIEAIAGREAVLVQNGIDVDGLKGIRQSSGTRAGIVSLRGLTPLYRIHEIVRAWRCTESREPLRFIYPFWHADYRADVLAQAGAGSEDLGRLSREHMYRLLVSARLAVSIPSSDSSPRSVYEAIFCGCPVAATYAPWVDAMPPCMRERLILVDLDDGGWLTKALDLAHAIAGRPYVPSEAALEAFDQTRSLRRAGGLLYDIPRSVPA